MYSGETKTYKLRLSTRASKYLSSIDVHVAKRLLDKIEILKSDPYHAPNVKLLAGPLAGRYRLRIGRYRAVYEIDEHGSVVIILVIGPRGSIYNKV